MVRPRPVFRTQHRTLVRGLLPADHFPDQRNLDQGLGELFLQRTSRRVYAFCGLARNPAFLDTVQQTCGELAGHMGFEDHHPYRPADMQRIVSGAHANNSECLVTTDKDFVRLPQTMRLPMPLLVLGIQIEFSDDAGNTFYRFIEQQFERIIRSVL
jgi:tetraacyldisaccharide 4'-kinase